VLKQISFADQIGAEVVFIPGWFDIAPNDLTSYSIARGVLGRQRMMAASLAGHHPTQQRCSGT
jgi:hypothetical protein